MGKKPGIVVPFRKGDVLGIGDDITITIERAGKRGFARIKAPRSLGINTTGWRRKHSAQK